MYDEMANDNLDDFYDENEEFMTPEQLSFFLNDMF